MIESDDPRIREWFKRFAEVLWVTTTSICSNELLDRRPASSSCVQKVMEWLAAGGDQFRFNLLKHIDRCPAGQDAQRRYELLIVYEMGDIPTKY